MATIPAHNGSLFRCNLEDSSFGPAVRGCQSDSFDFTLLFEQSILSIAPSALLLILTPFRIWQFSRESVKVRYHPLHLFKIAASILIGALQLVLLVLWSQRSEIRVKTSISTAVLGLLDSLALCVLSHFEHTRSIRPSTIICVYLSISSAFDAVQCRTLWLVENTHTLPAVFSTMLTIKVLMLSLEIQGKQHILKPKWQQLCPESKSGFISRSVFWWLNDLMRDGFRKTLSVETLYATDQKLESQLLLRNQEDCWASRQQNGKHSLLLCTIRSVGRAFLLSIFPRLCLTGFKFSQPFLINRVIEFVEDSSGRKDESIGYGLIGATGVIYLGLAISTGFNQHTIFRSVTMIRGALVSQIYSKTLTLNSNSIRAEGSAALTLMSTDVDRICTAFESLHELWANPIEICIAIWLLERQLGVGCIGPVITVVLAAMASTHLSKFMGPARKEWNEAVQERVSVTSNIVGSMKEVKLLGLVISWLTSIQALRVKELDLSKKFRRLIVYMNVIGNTPSNVAPVLTFGIFILVALRTGQVLTIATAFTSLSIISLLTSPLALLNSAFTAVGGTQACFQRIQAFLLINSYQDYRKPFSVKAQSDQTPPQRYPKEDVELSKLPTLSQSDALSIAREVMTVKNASFSAKRGGPLILKNISIRVMCSTLTIVIGKVGSGKSTLLKGLLGEIHCSSGSVHMSGKGAAFCDQTSWLVNSSIKQNIIGQSGVDETWYQTVITACALQKDLAQFPEVDKLAIGSNGLSLSGGQKQRVALARAIYSRKEILILDDILSGLDWPTRDLVWTNVFGPNGLLRQHGVTVVLATHTLHHLKDAHNIIVLGNEGQIVEQGDLSKIEKGNGYARSSFISSRASEDPHEIDHDAAETTELSTVPKQDYAEINKQRDFLRRSGDTSLYTYYFESIGWKYGLAMVLLNSTVVFFIYFPQIWLQYWTEDETTHPGKNTGMYYGVYVFFSAACLFFLGLNIWFMFVVVIPKSAQNLHLILLKTVLSAPLSFFVSTDSGSIVNRFSQDMSLIDMSLPTALFTTIFATFQCVAGALLIFLGAKYLAAVIPVALIILYYLQSFYLKTSRQIRHLDLEAKSPLYTHLIETVAGLITIRAFGWQAEFQEMNTKLLDLSQRPYYLLFCIQRWLNMMLDLLVLVLAVLLVTFATQTTSITSAGAIGVALVNVLGFNASLANLISSWTSLETSLGAISRLRDFEVDTPAEPKPLDTKKLPENWPSRGRIEISDITASYTSTAESPVLSNVSLIIEPGEKIAVCGRTGSGKSSLLLTIFRLLELNSGTTTIDGINIADIPHNLLRSRLIAIPQEPVLFHGTVRFNITPQHLLSSSPLLNDQALISALQKVEIWDDIFANGGLDADMANIPLSQGQKQLFCLARAILCKGNSRILLLDEAMSSVDEVTERLMVKVIEEEFVGHTVVSVVHKLDSVSLFDRIVVLERGRIVEVGRPAMVFKERSASSGDGLIGRG